MASESNHGVVVRILVPVVFIVIAPSIIEVIVVGGSSHWLNTLEFARGHDHSEIPELHVLIFAIAENVSYNLLENYLPSDLRDYSLPSPLLSIYVIPSVCPTKAPAARLSPILLVSHTLTVVSSDPEYRI